MNYCHHPWERYWMPYIKLDCGWTLDPSRWTCLWDSLTQTSSYPNQCIFFWIAEIELIYGVAPLIYFLFVLWLILLPCCKKDCIILSSGSINSFPPWHQKLPGQERRQWHQCCWKFPADGGSLKHRPASQCSAGQSSAPGSILAKHFWCHLLRIKHGFLLVCRAWESI